MLNGIDKERIGAAVARAEEGSSGEIVCALAEEVSHYRETPLAWAAGVALALPPLALTLGAGAVAPLLGTLAWTQEQASAVEGEIALSLTLYAGLQAALFVATFLIVSIPAVRRALTPAVLKRHKVAGAARHQFAALAARAHGSETGVLIFVGLIDRQVQILADAAIHQRCGDSVWERAAGAIRTAMKAGDDPTAGIVAAVEICGAALVEHFPSDKPRDAGFTAAPIEV